jgi:tetratricopeptide (TPR) repeat protein
LAAGFFQARREIVRHLLHEAGVEERQRLQLLERARRDEAVDAYSSAIDRDLSDLASIWTERGKAFAELGKFTLAVRDFERAAEISPASSRFADLGLALLADGDVAGFRNVLARLLAESQGASSATEADRIAYCGNILPAGSTDEAQTIIKLAKRAVADDTTNWMYRETLGAALYRAGRYSDAVDELNAARQMAPGNWGHYWTQYFLAMAHHQLGQTDVAKDWLARATRNHTNLDKYDWEGRLDLRILKAEADSLLQDVPK